MTNEHLINKTKVELGVMYRRIEEHVDQFSTMNPLPENCCLQIAGSLIGETITVLRNPPAPESIRHVAFMLDVIAKDCTKFAERLDKQ